MPTYITWETARERWTFQRRIPEYARAYFGGRTTIRHHFGAIPEALAIAKASQLADHYKTLFDQLKSASANRHIDTESERRVSFILEGDIGARFIATWKMGESQHFQDRLASMKDAPEEMWITLQCELTDTWTRARQMLRSYNADAFNEAATLIQDKLNIQLDGTPAAMNSLTQEFNSARVIFYADCLEVIQGSKPVSSLFPDVTSQLPLTTLWGDPADRLVQHWKERNESINGYLNPKTLDKYTGITNDLGLVLGRRPVQSLSRSDIKALIKLWSSKGNGATTINDKLSILLSLIRPFDTEQRLESIFADTSMSAPAHYAARLPFTEDQLGAFSRTVFQNPKVREDDRMLLALLMQLGTRIEEIYQLQVEDLEPYENGWIVRFADHRQTGHGDARLKNTASARRLPLNSGVFPDLDTWLMDRVAGSGYIFPNGSRNKYGIRSAAASRRLNRLLRQLFPDDRRLVLQSTRNTASRVMRRSNTDPRVRHRYLGHADVGIHDRHYDPGVLLDDRDLQSGANAIATFLMNM